jgi:hypothetical protein
MKKTIQIPKHHLSNTTNNPINFNQLLRLFKFNISQYKHITDLIIPIPHTDALKFQTNDITQIKLQLKHSDENIHKLHTEILNKLKSFPKNHPIALYYKMINNICVNILKEYNEQLNSNFLLLDDELKKLQDMHTSLTSAIDSYHFDLDKINLIHDKTVSCINNQVNKYSKLRYKSIVTSILDYAHKIHKKKLKNKYLNIYRNNCTNIIKQPSIHKNSPIEPSNTPELIKSKNAIESHVFNINPELYSSIYNYEKIKKKNIKLKCSLKTQIILNKMYYNLTNL